MRFLLWITVSALTIVASACSNDPNATRQQARNATEDLKRDTRQATGELKKETDQARTSLTAAAQGVREGINDKASSQVDLNTANKPQLMGLPGIDEAQANAIIADRPYRNPHETVRKGAISEDQYQKIADHVTIGTK